jgi:GTPase SAR1 family protein
MGGKSSKNKANAQPKGGGKKDFKFLLLGSGESGKTTFHKQIKLLFDQNFKEEEVRSYIPNIYANVLTTMVSLTNACFKTDENNPFDDMRLLEDGKKFKEMKPEDLILNDKELKKYSPELHQSVVALWADNKVKEAYEKFRYEYHIFDGAGHFLDNLERIKPPNYVPNTEDILNCRRKTIGIVELKFTSEHQGTKLALNIVDVGGQRNERKKWERCFEGVNAVMYVASLGEYDQKCYEDDTTNRMLESLELFESVINNNFFRDAQILLFFNKRDVFAKKIKTSSLAKTFSDYEGGPDHDAGFKFIQQKFLDANKGDPNRIHMFLTQATDKDVVKETFDEVFKLLGSGSFGSGNSTTTGK